MPIPFLTPLALGATGLSAGLGIAQGIAQYGSNDKMQGRNDKKLQHLVEMERKGNLGLTGNQQQLLDQKMMAPVATAAAQQRSRGEQMLASAGGLGGASGGDLSRLRQEQATTTSQAQQQAALEIAAQDEARKLQQKNEIEQRVAMQAAMKKDDWNALFGTASEAAGTLGAMAGATPGTFGMAGLFGEKLTPENIAMLKKLPAATRARMMDEALFGTTPTE